MAREPLTIYATTWCGDCHRAKRWLDSRGVAYRWIDVEQDERALAQLLEISGGYRTVPTILFPDGSVLVEPSNLELARKLSPE